MLRHKNEYRFIMNGELRSIPHNCTLLSSSFSLHLTSFFFFSFSSLYSDFIWNVKLMMRTMYKHDNDRMYYKSIYVKNIHEKKKMSSKKLSTHNNLKLYDSSLSVLISIAKGKNRNNRIICGKVHQWLLTNWFSWCTLFQDWLSCRILNDLSDSWWSQTHSMSDKSIDKLSNLMKYNYIFLSLFLFLQNKIKTNFLMFL